MRSALITVNKFKLCFCLCIALLCAYNTYAQNASRFLIVDAQDQQPLVGVAVYDGKRLISSSDSLGYVKLNLQRYNGELSFYLLGYQRVVIHKGDLAKTDKISLQALVQDLNTVEIKTGYQSLNKERATGSFTQLNEQDLQMQISSTLLPKLEGLSAGVNFDHAAGGRPNFTIRGISSINAAKQPLIVLNNFPYYGDIELIDPNDIQSITLLKDAAASSIWGAKASNGVLVITTKSGKYNSPTTIQLQANIQIIPKKDILKSNTFMRSSDFIAVEQLLFTNGYYNATLANNITYPVVSPMVALLDKNKRGLISAEELEEAVNQLKQNDVRKDIKEELWQNELNQQYALNINGGTSLTNYAFFAGYTNGNDYLANLRTRLTLKGNYNYKLTEKLSLTTSIAVIDNLFKKGRTDYGQIRQNAAQNLYPYARFVDNDGNAVPMPKTYRLDYVDTAGRGKLLDWKYYPLLDDNYINSRNQTRELLGQFAINYKLLPILNLNVNYQYSKQDILDKTISNEGSFATNDLINRFTQINWATGTIKYVNPRGSMVSQNSATQITNSFRLQGNFNQQWADSEISVIAGAELNEQKSQGNSSLFSGYNQELGIVNTVIDAVNPQPLYFGGTGYIGQSQSFSGTLNRFVSYYANTAYTHKNKYVLSASVRRDMSNLFGVNANQKGRPFWSAGVMWKIGEEDFYQSEYIPYLRLRATYGYSGNVDQSMSAVTALSFVLGINQYTRTQQAAINKSKNPELRWEKTGILNVGIDFKTNKKRIWGSIEYYYKNSTDLLGDDLIDITGGLKGGGVVRRNVGQIRGEGMDISINTTNLNGPLSWQSTYLFSYNRNWVKKYYLKTYQASSYISASGGLAPIIGNPVYGIYSYASARLNPLNGNPRGYLNGELSENYTALTGSTVSIFDAVYHGSATPKYFGAMMQRISYKQWALDLNVTYKFAYFFKARTINYSTLFNNYIQHTDYEKRWQKPGDELVTAIPSMVYPNVNGRDNFNVNTASYVHPADHIRLQFVNLSYALKNSNSSLFKQLKLGLQASNLGIVWRKNKLGLDPTTNDLIPQQQTFAFSLSCKL